MRVKSRSRNQGRLALTALALAMAAPACGGFGQTEGMVPGGSEPGGSGKGGRGGGSSGGAGSNATPGSGGNNGGSGPPTAFQPGRVTMRRLNAPEYDNTIRDLLGLDLQPAARPSVKFDFPADEWGDGFFNDGDVLTSSPLTVEKFLAAAQYAIDQAMDPAPTNMARKKLLICEFAGAAEATCLPKIIAELGRRAFRRPVTDDDMKPYLALVALAKGKGDTAEVGLKLALSALLVSPGLPLSRRRSIPPRAPSGR